MATRMKPIGYRDLDRNSQLANALWPNLAPPEIQRDMLNIVAPEKRARFAGRMGVVKPMGPDYSKVPGLVRKPAAQPWEWWNRSK